MSFSISTEAAKWFRDEFNLGDGEHLQFYIKIYGGIPTPQASYFLGIRPSEAGDSSQKAVAEGITFYFNETDTWFLDDYDLNIVLESGEPQYNFIPKNETSD